MSVFVNARRKKGSKPMIRDLYGTPIEIGSTIVFNNGGHLSKGIVMEIKIKSLLVGALGSDRIRVETKHVKVKNYETVIVI
jgi:hypothetical protein